MEKQMENKDENKKVCFTRGDDWLGRDGRFNSWVFRFRGPDVDEDNLYIKNTSGEFYTFPTEVAIGKGDYLIVASQTGSRAHHYYSYALVAMNQNGEPEEIFDKIRFGRKLKELCKKGRVSADSYSQAMKSVTGRMLLWVKYNDMDSIDPTEGAEAVAHVFEM